MSMQGLILVGIREIWPSEGVFLETDILKQEKVKDRLRRFRLLLLYIGLTTLV